MAASMSEFSKLVQSLLMINLVDKIPADTAKTMNVIIGIGCFYSAIKGDITVKSLAAVLQNPSV